jgi:calcium-dependent protein kinase
VKIADFGLACFIPKSSKEETKQILLFEKCGTPCYVAPEIFSGKGYDQRCDIFSVGVVLFNILTGYYLFGGANNQEIL